MLSKLELNNRISLVDGGKPKNFGFREAVEQKKICGLYPGVTSEIFLSSL